MGILAEINMESTGKHFKSHWNVGDFFNSNATKHIVCFMRDFTSSWGHSKFTLLISCLQTSKYLIEKMITFDILKEWILNWGHNKIIMKKQQGQASVTDKMIVRW